MPSFVYRTGDITDIAIVSPLWYQLNDHHHAHARAHQAVYERMTFEKRKEHFERIAAAGALRVDLAPDTAADRYIGYCITSLSPDGTGEIESIFVEEHYHSAGIGTALVQRALAWLEKNSPARIQVSIADGNEETFSFYRRFGFYPRRTILEQKRG